MKRIRILSAVLLAITVFIGTSSQTTSFAQARMPTGYPDSEVTNYPAPRYTYIMSTHFSLNVSDDGASYSLFINAISDVTEISGWATLYKKNAAGNYVSVDSEYLSSSSCQLDVDSTLSTDGSGSYRLKFVGTVSADDGSEPIILTKTDSY